MTYTRMTYMTAVLDRPIEITAGFAGGRPRIAGHRITVQNIVIWHERMGKSIDEICAEYGLMLAEVHAALVYYFDHQEEIDQRIENDEALVAAQRKRTSSVLENRISPYSLRG
jgi:uncharacterized protein (DUF433 family)